MSRYLPSVKIAGRTIADDLSKSAAGPLRVGARR
jgi:hypothetical protein